MLLPVMLLGGYTAGKALFASLDYMSHNFFRESNKHQILLFIPTRHTDSTPLA